jgi:glutathione synthase/RimK-type ligase-like ATP-grasp enzyme
MKRCCFLSMDDMAGYVSDDELAVEPLASLGWHVETVSWRDRGVDWSRFDLVVIRTTWDYQKYPDEFIATLERIDTATRLENSLDVVGWNLDKRYLRELYSRGVRIVPTIWDGVYDKSSFDQWLAELETDEVIIKPTVSATAQNTFRLKHFDEELTAIFEQRPFIVQPFLRTVIDEGEYSLFFFNSELSHTILKTPKPGDFRVQEEHGGLITETQPSEKLLDAARKVIRAIDQGLLYARVDLVRDHDDEFAVMELELIEPALYLRMNADGPQRFAVAIDALFK